MLCIQSTHTAHCTVVRQSDIFVNSQNWTILFFLRELIAAKAREKIDKRNVEGFDGSADGFTITRLM